MHKFRATDLAPGFAPKVSAGDNEPIQTLLTGDHILHRSAESAQTPSPMTKARAIARSPGRHVNP